MSIKYIKQTSDNVKLFISLNSFQEALYKINHYVIVLPTSNSKIIYNVHLTSKKLHNSVLLKSSIRKHKKTHVVFQLTTEHADRIIYLKSEVSSLEDKRIEAVQKEIIEIFENHYDLFSVADLYEGFSIPLTDHNVEFLDFDKPIFKNSLFSDF